MGKSPCSIGQTGERLHMGVPLNIKKMEINMTQLCDLDPMLDDAKILARVISIWKSRPKQRPNEVWSLDAVLQDQMSCFVHVKTDDDRQLGEELKDASTDEIPLSDDFDDRPNEYDLMESFINDGPLENEETQEDSDIKKMEINMTQLCDLDPMLDDAKILARVISIWKSHPKQRPNEVWSLDAVLQDQMSCFVHVKTDDDRQVGEELKDASTDEIPLSDDFDDRPNEYDLMDSFINDGPLENEATQEDSDSDN
ncbi:hypothetical protein Tco_0419423 [Tanacetum coccineum]